MTGVAMLRAIVAGSDETEVRLVLGGYTTPEDVAWLYGLVGSPVDLAIKPMRTHRGPKGPNMGQIPKDGANGPSA